MTDELSTELHDGPDDRLDEMGRSVVKVAASAVVATSLVSALQEPPRPELMSLPEPTPIVQMYEAFDEDPVPDEDDEQDETVSRWRRLLKVLKLLMIVLALAGSIALAVLKGCTGILAAPSVPDNEQEEQSSDVQQPAEDERGVAF